MRMRPDSPEEGRLILGIEYELSEQPALAFGLPRHVSGAVVRRDHGIRRRIPLLVVDSVDDPDALELCERVSLMSSERGGQVVHILSPLQPGESKHVQFIKPLEPQR